MKFDFFRSVLFAPKDDNSDAGGGSTDKKDEAGDDESSDESGENGESDDDDSDENSDDEDDEEDTDEPSPDEIKETRALIKLLKNPKTQTETIREMAQRAGLLGNQETRSEVKKDAKSVKALLGESLGTDYAFLADKLGPAIELILEQERESNKQVFAQVEQKQTEHELDQVSSKLNRETKGEFNRLYGRIVKLADEILPAPGVSTETYLRNLYKIAAGERGSSTNKKTLAEKINRNANNAAERLNQRGGSGKGVEKLPDNASISQIVAYSARQVERSSQSSKNKR